MKENNNYNEIVISPTAGVRVILALTVGGGIPIIILLLVAMQNGFESAWVPLLLLFCWEALVQFWISRFKIKLVNNNLSYSSPFQSVVIIDNKEINLGKFLFKIRADNIPPKSLAIFTDNLDEPKVYINMKPFPEETEETMRQWLGDRSQGHL